MKSAKEVISWVLEAIKRERKLQEYGLLFIIKFDLKDLTSKDTNSPSIEDARKIVYLLEKKHKALEIADIDNPKEREHHEKNALDYHPTRETATCFILEINREKFDEVYAEYQKSQQKKDDVLKLEKLTLDLARGTLRYKTNKSKEISPKQDEIRFLALLMRRDDIVEYKEIAEDLDMTAKVTHPADMTVSVQTLRKNLVYILEDAGMTREEIRHMIICKRNTGYKLRR